MSQVGRVGRSTVLQWMTQVKGGGTGGGRCFKMKYEVLCCNGCLKGGEGELKADIAGCIPIDTMSLGRSSSLDIFSHFPPLCTCGVV